MDYSLALIIRSINGVSALVGAFLIAAYYIRKDMKSDFNLLWALGFGLWGISILARNWLTFDSPIFFALLTGSGLCLLMGTTVLIGIRKIFLIIYIGSLSLFFSFPKPSSLYMLLSAAMFFGLMSAASIIMRVKIGSAANWFLAGWLLSLFANSLPAVIDEPAIVDLAAIFAKWMFAYGTISPGFLYYEIRSSKVVARRSTKNSQDELDRRLTQVFTDVLIASVIRQRGSASGYDIISTVNSTLGILLGPGSLYPLLHRMEKIGLLTSLLSGRKKVYSLTKEGREWHRNIIERSSEANKLLGLMQYVSQVQYQELK